MADFLRKYKEIILFMFAYWFICFVMLFADGSFLYAALSWNVFLAVLPLFFVKNAETAWEQGKTFWIIIWVFLWFFFFPNSLYVVTDFIHISGEKFIWIAKKYSSNRGVVYSSEITVWAKLLVIGLGYLFSLLVGLESLNIFERNIRKKVSKFICYSVISVIILLSGIGVYIGRFLRFNSWDIVLTPFNLLKQVVNRIDIFFIQFVLVFSLFIVCSYILYKIFRKLSQSVG